MCLLHSPEHPPSLEYPKYLVPSDDEEEEEASEEDEDEEEEHLAQVDSVLPASDYVPLAEETKPFETDESTATPPPPQTIVPVSMTRHHRAQISVRPYTPPSSSIKALIAEFASKPTPLSPPPSPLSPLSSPLPRIPSPPLHTSLTYAEAPLGYRAAMIQLRAASPPPVRSPPLLLPSIDRMSDIPEMNMPFRKRLCLTALVSRFKVRESSTTAAAGQTGHTLAHRVNYGLVDIVDASILAFESRVMTASWSRLEDRSTDLEASIRTLEAQKTTTPMTDGAIKALIAQGIVDALAEYETNKISRNGDDSHDLGSGRRTERATRECTYSDFLKCQPLNFKGTEGNSHIKTVGHDVAYEMTWKTLKKMMIDKYCPRSEIKKLEIKIWNLNVKGTDAARSSKVDKTQCHHETKCKNLETKRKMS
nr:hypothetical protein [Tanacetum cinerariifolium]